MTKISFQNLINGNFMMNCILFFLKTTLSRVFMEKAGMNITYSLPLRVLALCDMRHLKSSTSIHKVKNLTTFHSPLHYPLVPLKILWARVRGGLQGTELLISAFSIISQTTKAHLSYPAFWYMVRGVLTPGPYPSYNRASLSFSHSAVSSSQFQETSQSLQILEKKESYSVLSYKLTTGAENVCGLCEGFFLQVQAREDQIPCIKHSGQSQNSRSQTQFQLYLAPWYSLSTYEVPTKHFCLSESYPYLVIHLP